MMAGMSNRSSGSVTPLEIRRGDLLRAVNGSRGALLAASVQLALDPWRRLRGLIGRTLGDGEAMLIRPCGAVHTCFMGYPIDVLFLDEEGRIVAVAADLAPWRFSSFYGAARCALELPAGTVARSGTREGDAVAFERRG